MEAQTATKVWNRAKSKFLEQVAVYWLFSNRVFEILLFLGIAIFIWQEGWLRYFAGAIIIYSIMQIFYRIGLYDGFFDGYESGFTEAVGKTFSEIEREAENMSIQERQARKENIEQGFRKLLGIWLTWKKIKIR